MFCSLFVSITIVTAFPDQVCTASN